MAELIAAVHVKDPERPGTTVLFRPGDDVPERFWPGMSNPDLWKDGGVPQSKSTLQSAGEDGDDGKGDDAGSDKLPEPEQAPADPDSEPDKKPAARKAANRTGSRRQAAAEGTGGQ
jgi:hypothetical protein